jgi:hypothetical protein
MMLNINLELGTKTMNLSVQGNTFTMIPNTSDRATLLLCTHYSAVSEYALTIKALLLHGWIVSAS